MGGTTRGRSGNDPRHIVSTVFVPVPTSFIPLRHFSPATSEIIANFEGL